ncbi:MAG TPA: hypothetical protein VG873_15310 [Burkholderiales bacterium]|nr:hypothetical protein [Burkholderiales bacterium]
MTPRNEIKAELYRTVLLLHPDPILIRTLEAWCAGAEDAQVLADLRNWNEAKYLEMQEWLSSLTGRDLEAVTSKLEEYRKAA